MIKEILKAIGMAALMGAAVGAVCGIVFFCMMVLPLAFFEALTPWANHDHGAGGMFLWIMGVCTVIGAAVGIYMLLSAMFDERRRKRSKR